MEDKNIENIDTESVTENIIKHEKETDMSADGMELNISETREDVDTEEANETEIIPSMDEFADEIEASLRKIYTGDIMEGEVIAVDEEGATVDLNYFAPGRIPAEEFSADPCFNVARDVKIGEKVKCIVKTPDDGGGNIILSKKDADSEFSWEKLKEMMENETAIEGSVSGITNSGVIMYVEGIRGFIPASKLDVKYVEDTEPYLGKNLKVKIIDLNEEKQKLILSAKDFATEAFLKEREAKASKVDIGAKITGTVESLKDYGAFIDIGDGLSGLLHISEISDQRIAHPKSVLKVGQKVDVMVLKVEKGKISLSMKALKDAEEQKLEEEAYKYQSEYIPNTPFADLLKDIKLDD